VLAGSVLAQVAAGVTNLALLAPVWMQIVHLLLADVVWIALVTVAAEALLASEPAPLELAESAGA
jgi:heme A synthase